MKKLLIISIAFFSLSFLGEAQLLEDSQNRLKTAKVKSQGFLFFRNKNKIRSASGTNKQKSTAPSPRYSQGVANFRNKGVAPRFSSGSPFQSKSYRISPRYSIGSPFRGSHYRVAPRYSAGNPFRGSQYKVAPRYSRGNPFRGKDYRTSPRYSVGHPFRGKDYKVSPRFSRGNPFRGMSFNVSPRYSVGNPFRGVDWKIKPRFSNPKNRFVVNNFLKKQLRYYNETSNYKGDWRVLKRGGGDQHPSSNYHFAMRFSNPKVRKVFRKFNIFWVRLNGSKEESNGVKASVRSPKFDKNEKDIWNN